MKTPVFEGACTAIISPFCADGIDYPALDRQLDFQIRNGISAIVVAGTTGENATLEIHEHAQLVDFSVRKCAKKIKVIVGVGGNNTAACLKKARLAEAAGADAILMTPPYYNKCSRDGLISHFYTVADNVGIPLILYNVPSRTLIGIDEAAYGILAKHPNINGTKEASGNISLISTVISEYGEDLNLWSGNDDNTVALMGLGAKGVISVMSNILPAEVSEICSLCAKGNFEEAFALYSKYSSLCKALFIDVNPIPVKSAMELMSLDRGILRLPLTRLSDDKKEKLKRELKKLDLISR